MFELLVIIVICVVGFNERCFDCYIFDFVLVFLLVITVEYFFEIYKV